MRAGPGGTEVEKFLQNFEIGTGLVYVVIVADDLTSS
jgi:hypothetical protein